MPIDLNSLGGFLPHLGALTDAKTNEPAATAGGADSQSWISGLVPRIIGSHWPGSGAAGSSDSKASSPQQSSIDWLFGHIGDAANVMAAGSAPAAGGQADAATQRAASRAAITSQIQEDNPDLNWKQVDRRMHAQMIGSQYMLPGQIQPTDMKGKVGNLESEEERNKFLSKFTQFDPKNPNSSAYCGPTALIAAAIHADGAKGLAPMVASMQADLASDMQYAPGDKASAKQAADLAALQEKIAKGELTNKDMKLVQESLYKQLKKQQEANGTSDDPKDPGISDATMYEFIKRNEYAQEMFKKGNSRLSMIDNDGDYKRNHWILRMGGSDPKDKSVYDPWARSGGQIVRDPDQVDDYEKTNLNDYNERGRPVVDVLPDERDKTPGAKPA